MQRGEKRRSLRSPDSSKKTNKFRRITEENCRSAKIIANECRMSGYPIAAISTAYPEASNDPSDFLSCDCLGSPRQIWRGLCNSGNGLYERKIQQYTERQLWINERIIVLQNMMELCERLRYRRETYYRAMDMFDRFMVLGDYDFGEEIEQARIMGIFMVYLASKIEEKRHCTWQKIVEYMSEVSDPSFLDQMDRCQFEMEIILNLDWSFRAVTPFDWAKIYMHMMRTYSIYKRIKNLTLAQQSTPTKKRTRINCTISDDEEVDLFTWAQLDNLVIGESDSYVDWYNQVGIAQVLDLCTADLSNFAYTYRELGAAAFAWMTKPNEEIFTKITGMKMKELRLVIDFVDSYGKIYSRHIRERGFNLAHFPDQELYRLYASEQQKQEQRRMSIKKSVMAQNAENIPPKNEHYEQEAKRGEPVPVEMKRSDGAQKSITAEPGPRSRPRPRILRRIPKVPPKEIPKEASSRKIRKKRKIYVSDSEVSLLEVDVNAPNFLDVSADAGIPKQKRLRILSPKKECIHSSGTAAAQSKSTSLRTATAPSISRMTLCSATRKLQNIPPKVSKSSLSGDKSASTTDSGKYVTVVCQCGCGRRIPIDASNKKEVETMTHHIAYELSTKGRQIATMVYQEHSKEASEDASSEREIPIPQLVQLKESRMNVLYTQSLPLNRKTMRRVVYRLEQFWLAEINREPPDRRRSHSPQPRKREATGTNQPNDDDDTAERRKSI